MKDIDKFSFSAHYDSKSKCFVVKYDDFPQVIGTGNTVEKAIACAREALEGMLSAKLATTFIEQVMSLRDYHVGGQPKDAKSALDGFIYSFFAMCDGDLVMNDFHHLSIVDNAMAINDKVELCELFVRMNNEK